jgi:hypothetical protein
MIQAEKSTKDITGKSYPKIMISNGSDLVVLFTSFRTGIIIISYDKYHQVGEHRTDWFEDSFTDYNEPITLKNV